MYHGRPHHQLKGKSIALFDSGDRVFSTVDLQAIRNAVASVLQEKLMELAILGKKATGAEEWAEGIVSTDGLVEQARTELKREQPNPYIFVLQFIRRPCKVSGTDITSKRCTMSPWV